jgi:ubiquinone biosynthesis protein UbiJ
MPATPVWLAAIESLLNRGIGQSLRARAAAARLQGTCMELRIEGLAAIRIAACTDRIALASAGRARAGGASAGGPVAGDASAAAGAGGAAAGPGTSAAAGAPDAVIAGPPLALLDLFARRGDSAAPRGAERVHISGDAEIAARYRELLQLARPDWEEELSRLLGDLPARRISLAARAAFAWGRGFARSARANVAEYLQEESRDLVSKPEVQEFLGQVDTLRETADRVEARIARLERRLESRREPGSAA